MAHFRDRFMDEGDATQHGLQWLRALGKTHHANRLDTMVGEGSGGSASVWRDHTLLGYILLLRDPLNWTELICHDLVDDTPAPLPNDLIQQETS